MTVGTGGPKLRTLGFAHIHRRRRHREKPGGGEGEAGDRRGRRAVGGRRRRLLDLSGVVELNHFRRNVGVPQRSTTRNTVVRELGPTRTERRPRDLSAAPRSIWPRTRGVLVTFCHSVIIEFDPTGASLWTAYALKTPRRRNASSGPSSGCRTTRGGGFKRHVPSTCGTFSTAETLKPSKCQLRASSAVRAHGFRSPLKWSSEAFAARGWKKG